MIYEIAESKLFGKVVPKKNDVYQELAFDSLFINQVTMIRGHAGTGKSYISFGVLFNLLDRGVTEKIIVFANTVATKGAAKLGFYPGSRTEKLMDSQIGNFLISKIGRREWVERLIEDEKLILLPLSGCILTEAQNLDKEMMKLALQRIGHDSICIIDGDYET